MTYSISSTCTTLLDKLRKEWDYTTASVLADAFAENDDPYNAALWYVLAYPSDDERRLAYAAECEREVEKKCSKGRWAKINGGYDAEWIKCQKCGGTGTIREPRDAARAKFIRVQVELAKMGKPPDTYSSTCLCPQCKRWEKINNLRRRERELWSKVHDSYQLPWRFAGYERGIPQLEDMSHGFVFRVTSSADLWLKHAQALRECQPVTSVRLTTLPTEEDFLRFKMPVKEIGIEAFNVWTYSPILTLEAIYPGITFHLPTDRPDEDELDPGHRTTRGG